MSRSLFHNLNRLVRARAELAEADAEAARGRAQSDAKLAQSIGGFARVLEAFLPQVLRLYCAEAAKTGGAAPGANADVGVPSTGAET